MAETLEMLGHQTTYAQSATQALQCMAEHPYDLIISDYRMPDLSGRDFYRRICSDFPGFTHRTLFLTGDTLADETQAFLASTGNPYLTKPFRVTEIQGIIEQAVAGAESSSDAISASLPGATVC